MTDNELLHLNISR